MTTTPASPPSRDFDPAALASITSDCLLVEMDDVMDAARFIVGRDFPGEEYLSLEQSIQAEILRQFPKMPRQHHKSGWVALHRAVRAVYGTTVTVTGGPR